MDSFPELIICLRNKIFHFYMPIKNSFFLLSFAWMVKFHSFGVSLSEVFTVKDFPSTVSFV